MNQIDIVIPIAPQDFHSLEFTYPFIKKAFPEGRIVIIANAQIEKQVRTLNNVLFLDENSLVDGLSFEIISKIINERYPKAVRRTGWYFQQFLKLAYAFICKDEYYLTWDSDTIPLRHIPLFSDEGTPFLDYLPKAKGDEAYFDLLNNLSSCNFQNYVSDKSFITEHMVFKVTMVKAMFNDVESCLSLEGKNFYEKILYAIDLNYLNLSGFSEFETYAAYIQKKDGEYVLRKWNNLRNGLFYLGRYPSIQQLKWVSKSFDVVSLEDFDTQIFLNKLFCSSNYILNKIPFKFYYTLINPIYKVYYKIRLKIRCFIKR